MSNVDKETVLRIHRMLLKNDGAASIKLARAAAYDGDTDILNVLFEEHGPDAFVGELSKRRFDALERAAAGNQVAAMKWMLDRGALPGVHHSVEPQAIRPKIVCRAVTHAVENGAFDALEFIADRVPALRDFPLDDGVLVFRANRLYVTLPDEIVKRDGGLKYNRINLCGLMVLAISEAQKRKRDTSTMVERFKQHLDAGMVPTPDEVKMAVELGNIDCFKALLEAGASIVPRRFLHALRTSGCAASMLATLNDHLALTKKKFHKVFSSEDRAHEPYLYASFVARKGAAVSDAVVFMTDIADVLSAAGRWAANPQAERYGVEAARGRLSEEFVRFANLVCPAVISSSMLARAVEVDCVPMTKLLLDEGVNPTVKPDNQPIAHRGDEEKHMLPIHRCRSAEMVRLLHEYGVDVNTPLTHALKHKGQVTIDGNLFTFLCARGPHIPEMVYAIADCGGDIASKYSGRTINSISTDSPQEFKEAIKAARTGVAISTSLDKALECGTDMPVADSQQPSRASRSASIMLWGAQ